MNISAVMPATVMMATATPIPIWAPDERGWGCGPASPCVAAEQSLTLCVSSLPAQSFSYPLDAVLQAPLRGHHTHCGMSPPYRRHSSQLCKSSQEKAPAAVAKMAAAKIRWIHIASNVPAGGASAQCGADVCASQCGAGVVGAPLTAGSPCR